jgi:hypothetical protein
MDSRQQVDYLAQLQRGRAGRDSLARAERRSPSALLKLVALVVGMAGAAAAFYIHFRWTLVAAAPDFDLAVIAVIGGAIAAVAGLLLRLFRPTYIIWQALGVLAVVTLGHNAFHLRPDQMAVATSSPYVRMVQATAPPMSVNLFGRIFTMPERTVTAEEAAPPPQVGFGNRTGDDAENLPRRLILDSERRP